MARQDKDKDDAREEEAIEDWQYWVGRGYEF